MVLHCFWHEVITSLDRLGTKCEKQLLSYSVKEMLKYSCKYPVTTALQGTLALPAIPWLKVAGATYSKIGNCDLGSTECSTTA